MQRSLIHTARLAPVSARVFARVSALIPALLPALLATLFAVLFAGLPALAASPDAPGPELAPLPPEMRGDLAMARQQYVAAIEAYREGPANSAIILNKLGMAYHHMFAMDEAKKFYERSLRIRPSYPEALNNLGAIYYARRDYKKAIRYYHKALRLEPDSAPIYSNLGTAYFAQHKTERGLEAYRQAFALDPRVFEQTATLVTENLPAKARAEQDYCMAVLFAQSGQLDRALNFLRKALNEGFDDRKKILGDQTLASLRATPEFAELMTQEKLR